MAACSQHVDQRLDCIGIVCYQDPCDALAGVRAGEWSSGFLPADLVPVVRDGLGCPLLVMLCRKLCQHIKGLMVAAWAIQQRREFLDPSVLEKADGLGTGGKVLWCLLSIGILVVPKRILTVLEWIGGQVDFPRVRMLEGGEFGQMAQDIGVGNSFSDLPVIGGGSAQ